MSLTASALWWPSTLFQTTTLELCASGRRLLVDPGVSPWEIEEVAAGGVDYVLVTHADWDHVLGIGMLPDAEVIAGGLSAERLRADGAAEEIEAEARAYYVPTESLERLRVDRIVDPLATLELGPWQGRCLPASGHVRDGMAVSFPNERLLVVGDYLSELEIPFIHASPNDYRRTLDLLIAEIEDERPTHVVVGHGSPHPPDRALELAREDRAYVEALIAFAESGRGPDEAAELPYPERSSGDFKEHVSNLTRACELQASGGAPRGPS